MEQWFKNKKLTRDEVIKVQYEQLLLSLISEENATMFVKANFSKTNFPPIKERTEATMAYIYSLPGNPYVEINKLSKESQLYALTKAANGEFEKDKKEMENEFFSGISKTYGKN